MSYEALGKKNITHLGFPHNQGKEEGKKGSAARGKKSGPEDNFRGGIGRRSISCFVFWITASSIIDYQYIQLAPMAHKPLWPHMSTFFCSGRGGGGKGNGEGG